MTGLILIIITVLLVLLMATVIFFPLIKLRKEGSRILPKEQKQQHEDQDSQSGPFDSETQVIINIENYHEAQNELPYIRCEHCGNKNKSDARKCQDCGATL